MSEGLKQEQSLREGGFSDEEVTQWKAETQQKLSDAGFSGKEVQEYFGVKEPNMAPVRQYVNDQLSKWRTSQGMDKVQGPPQSAESLPGPMPIFQGPEPAGGAREPASVKPKPTPTIMDALEAGWDMSVTGLMQGRPTHMLPEDAPMFHRIAGQAATVAGDLPAMIGGGVAGLLAGGAAGTATLPVIGTVGLGAAGMYAGANALPAGMRRLLMDHYEKGDIHDFGDFWERASGVFIDSLKGGAVGLATGGMGGAASKLVGAGAAPLVRTMAVTSSEIATMVTVGRALEGQAPKAQDFLDAAVVVGGLGIGARLSTGIASKMRAIYRDTGVRPEQIAEHAQNEPTVKAALLAKGDELPEAYQAMRDPKVPPPPPKDATTVKPPTVMELDALPEAKPQSEAQAKILGQVGQQPEAKEAGGHRFATFYKDWVDKLDPIHRAVESLGKDPEKMKADENPYILARMANDYRAKTKYALEKGVIDYKTLAQTGKPFREIIEPHKADLDGLNSYLISKRAIELEKRGIQSGFDGEAAKEVVRTGKAQYEGAARELVDFQNGILKYAKDSGVISEKSYNAMLDKGQAYIPLRRILEDGEGGGVAGKGKPGSLKALKGSDKKIQDPLVSIVENTESLFKIAEKNRAVESFVKLADATEGQDLIERMPSEMRPVEITSSEVGKILQEHGVDASEAEAFTVFRPKSKVLADNEFEVFRNGKREVYRTSEPVLAEAFKALDGDPSTMNVLFKIARGITAIKKLGISLTPDFIAKNMFRDQLTAGVFSKGGVVPFRDVIVATGELMKGEKGEGYYNWLKSGGANGTFLEMGERYLTQDLLKLEKETGLQERAWNVMKKPFEIMTVAGSIVEQATRLAEFKRVSGGASSGAKVFEGGFASREVTVDFQRMGAKISALNAITAFQNVSIQGLDRTARALKADPAGVAMKATAYITVPSVLLWWANKDDPRWGEIPRWQKDMFWIVMTEKEVYRIPKPQELGILFGSLPERILEKYFTDNPRAMKNFNETLQNLITPSLVPDAISPAVEQFFNMGLFTKHKIIPASLEKVNAEYQYTEYTSETGKQLGKFVSYLTGDKDSPFASPMRIDSVATAWGGTLGRYALQLADAALVKSGAVPDPVKPVSTLADMPVIRAFAIRYPSANAQSIQDFYDKFQENSKTVNTIKHLAKTGQVEFALQEMALKANQDKLLRLQGISDGLSSQQRWVQLVNQNKDIKPEEKRQLIDGVYALMISEAKMGVGLLDDFEKAMKQ
jgi:hypothetical protein